MTLSAEPKGTTYILSSGFISPYMGTLQYQVRLCVAVLKSSQVLFLIKVLKDFQVGNDDVFEVIFIKLTLRLLALTQSNLRTSEITPKLLCFYGNGALAELAAAPNIFFQLKRFSA